MPDLIYTTLTMLASVLELPPVYTFLRDRYFVTNPRTDFFNSEEVLMDIKDGEQRMAPVVIPRKKGINIAREGYRTERITPPLVAPERMLTVDDLNARGFGEALFTDMSVEDREAALLGKDLEDLEQLISNREENIAAECMKNNGYKLEMYADQYDAPKGEMEYEIRFYEGEDNPDRYTPAAPWNDPGAKRLEDLIAMVRMLTSRGKPVTDFVADSSVIDNLLSDDKIYKMLENRRMNLGMIDPEELPNGAAYYGHLTVGGRNLNLYSYDVSFYDTFKGKRIPVFAPGECILTAEKSGRALYGAVTQMEDDKKFHKYAGNRIPKYITDTDADTRKLRMSSRPVFVPSYVSPWASANLFR